MNTANTMDRFEGRMSRTATANWGTFYVTGGGSGIGRHLAGLLAARGAAVAAIAAWSGHVFLGNMGKMSEPGNALNSDKLAGENWALESGAITKQDCDRQSKAQAFREGCYARLTR